MAAAVGGFFYCHGVGYMSALPTSLVASSASCLCKADGVRFTQCYAWPLSAAAIRLVRQCFHAAPSYVAVLFVGVAVCSQDASGGPRPHVGGAHVHGGLIGDKPVHADGVNFTQCYAWAS